jgi:hypothetical protein
LQKSSKTTTSTENSNTKALKRREVPGPFSVDDLNNKVWTLRVAKNVKGMSSDNFEDFVLNLYLFTRFPGLEGI